MPVDLIPLFAFGMVGLTAVVSTMGGWGTIETGHRGVETRFGTVYLEEVEPGFYFKPLSSVREFSAKEIAVALDDLTPKAADNLFLEEMDLTVYYRVHPHKIADVEIKYAGMSHELPGNSVYAPAYDLVQTLTRNAAYESVATRESLTVHQQRELIGQEIKQTLQKHLDENDPETFVVSRAVVRTVTTDPAIEAAIQQAVNNQKKLEAMEIAVRIAEKEAEIRLREARGIAEANKVINNTLTPAYLQHESNKVLMAFAERGGTTTVVIPANMNAAPLINLPTAAPEAQPNRSGARAPARSERPQASPGDERVEPQHIFPSRWTVPIER